MSTTDPTTPIPEPADSSHTPLEDPMTTTDPITATPEPAPLAPAERTGVRVGTTVWGLVVAAIGLGLIAVAAGAVFDVQLALIVLIAAAGVALLVGSLLTAGGRRR